MEELDLDNILGAEEIDNLFLENENLQDKNNPEDKKEKEETTEVNTDTLFEKPESVGSEEITGKEDSPSVKDNTSPKFYSSIAKAFAEEGIFPDLDEETINKVNSPEEFRELVEQQIKASLDERQKRIDEALSVGIEPTEIQKYENTLNYLDSIKEENITDEGEKGETLRKQLIFQDFVNRGYSKERAQREVNKSFNAGTDIEDAKEALKSNKEYFQDSYEDLIKEAKQEEEKEIQKKKEQAATLKKSILEDKNVFGELEVDKTTRQKIYDSVTKPIYKDPSTGEYYTAVQKYEKENRVDFIKNVGLIFTLTDGFKNLDGLVKNKVKKEVKKGLRDLEKTLNNTSRTSDGNLNFVSGVNDSESFIKGNWALDI